MSVSADTNIYNEIFTENYNTFKTFTNNDLDRVQTIYLKLYALIETKHLVFTAKSLTVLRYKLKNFIKVSLYNDWKKDLRLAKPQLQVNEVKIRTVVENKLLLQDYQEESENTRDEINQYLSYKIFDFIKIRYDETENYVFTVYYLHDKEKKLTYKKLAKITGFSESKCCNIIQKIKKDLKDNFDDFLNK